MRELIVDPCNGERSFGRGNVSLYRLYNNSSIDYFNKQNDANKLSKFFHMSNPSKGVKLAFTN